MRDRVDEYISIVPDAVKSGIQELEFYGFLHFGMNTFLDKEWSDGSAPPALFCPEQLDTDQWIRTLKSAGMRGAILTCKHHDGFCLWPSRYTDYSVASSPCKRDIVGEAAASCKKYGLKFGIYLSPWDRHDPRYGTPEYNDFYVAQLEELLTGYGDIFVVWLDGACGTYLDGKEKQAYDFERYYETVRRLQPQCAISNCGPDVRWIGNEAGVTRKSEWSVVPKFAFDIQTIEENSQQADNPAFRKKGADVVYSDLGSRRMLEKYDELMWYPAEVDVSIRPGWFYHEKEDQRLRSVNNLLHLYYTAVGGNAMLLLNVPPDRRGRICELDAARLMEMGRRLESAFAEQVLFSEVTAPAGKEGFSIKNCLRQGAGSYSPAQESGVYHLLCRFREAKKIDKLVMREDLRFSQRIEAFAVEARCAGKWRRIYTGTTVGYQKIALFPAVDADAVRVTITACRREPYLALLRVYESDGTTLDQPRFTWLTQKVQQLNYQAFIFAENRKAARRKS